MSVVFYPDGLQPGGNLPRSEIKMGFRLFFLNQPEKARAFFTHYQDIPFFSMGLSAVLFLWALLTLEDKDAQDAAKSFATTRKLAAEQVSKLQPGRNSWFGFGGGTAVQTDSKSDNSQATSPADRVGSKAPDRHALVEVPADVAMVFFETLECESILLDAILMVVNGSVLEKIKAGVAIRSVWQRFVRIEKTVAQLRADGHELPSEANAILQFTIGCFNLICSVLPPRFVRVANFLGFPSSRATALKTLRESFECDGAASPLAGVLLLTHNTLMQSTYLLGNGRFRDDALAICVQAQQLYPGSGWFLLLQGRLAKLMRHFALAENLFERAMEAQAEWKPLADMCLYELGFVRMSAFSYKLALQAWELLLRDNDWSKTFYAYQCGICLLQLGRKQEALEMFARVSNVKTLQIQGKSLPVDLWSRRKVKQYVTETEVDLPLAHLEILLIFAAFNAMAREDLEQALRQVEEVGQARLLQADEDFQAVYHLLRGALLSQLGHAEEAEKHLLEVDELKRRIKRELWAIYYARYELAVLWHRLDGGGSARVQAKLEKAYSSHEHNFDVYLHMRVNMAQYHIRHGPELGLQTDGQRPSPLHPPPTRQQAAEEYDELLRVAQVRLGAGGHTMGAATEETRATEAAAVKLAPWWQGIDDPIKVTAL